MRRGHGDGRTTNAHAATRAMTLLFALLCFGCEAAGDGATATAPPVADDGGQLAVQDATDAGHQDGVPPLDADAGVAEVGGAADDTGVGAGDADDGDADDGAVDDGAADDGADAVPPQDAGPTDAAPIAKIVFGGDFVPFVMTNSADGTSVVGLSAKGQTSLPLIYGPQGGHHVWITTCVPKSVTGPIALQMRLRDVQTGALHAPSPVKLKTWHKNEKTISGYRCRGPLALYVDCPCAIHGRPLRLEVELQGAKGKKAWLWAPVVAVHGDTPCESPLSEACAK